MKTFNSVQDDAEGLEILKANLSYVPDFIFLDINMPEMNGMQCLPELKNLQHLRTSKIIVYSSSSSESIQQKRPGTGSSRIPGKANEVGIINQPP